MAIRLFADSRKLINSETKKKENSAKSPNPDETRKSRVRQWAGISTTHQPPLLIYSNVPWPITTTIWMEPGLVWEQKVEYKCSMLITAGWILKQFLHLWEGNKSVVDLLRSSVPTHEHSAHMKLHHNILYSPYPTVVPLTESHTSHQRCLA